MIGPGHVSPCAARSSCRPACLRERCPRPRARRGCGRPRQSGARAARPRARRCVLRSDGSEQDRPIRDAAPCSQSSGSLLEQTHQPAARFECALQRGTLGIGARPVDRSGQIVKLGSGRAACSYRRRAPSRTGRSASSASPNRSRTASRGKRQRAIKAIEALLRLPQPVVRPVERVAIMRRSAAPGGSPRPALRRAARARCGYCRAISTSWRRRRSSSPLCTQNRANGRPPWA